MVLKSMKNFSRIILFQLLILLFSCEEQGIIVKCPDCLEEEPLNTTLEIRVNPVNFSGLQVNVYEGNIEDNVLYTSLTSSGAETISVNVKVNKMYSATAMYFIDGKYYTAVDAATPRVRFSEDQCDEPCYYVYDRKVDLRLK